MFRPVSGLCSHSSPGRVVCSTRPSGSTARSIGSPGRSLSVTFSNSESGGGPDWAAATEGHARHTPSDAIKPAAHLTPWFIIALPSSVMESR